MKFSYLVVFCSLIINSGCKSEKKAVPKPNANSSDLGQGQYPENMGTGMEQFSISATPLASYQSGSTIRVSLMVRGAGSNSTQVAIINAPSGARIENGSSSNPVFLWPSSTVGSTTVEVMVRDMTKCQSSQPSGGGCELGDKASESNFNYSHDAKTNFQVVVNNAGSGGDAGGGSGGMSGILGMILKLFGGQSGPLSSILPKELLDQLSGVLGQDASTLTMDEVKTLSNDSTNTTDQ